MRAAAALLLACCAVAEGSGADKCNSQLMHLCRDSVSVSVAKCESCVTDNLSALSSAGCSTSQEHAFCALAPRPAATPLPDYWPGFTEWQCTDSKCTACFVQTCPLLQCVGPMGDGGYAMNYECTSKLYEQKFGSGDCSGASHQVSHSLNVCQRSAVSGKYIKRSCSTTLAAKPPVQLYNQTPTPGCYATGQE